MMYTERKTVAREHRIRNLTITIPMPYHCTNFVCNLKAFCNIVDLMLLKNYQLETDRYIGRINYPFVQRFSLRVRRVLAVD